MALVKMLETRDVAPDGVNVVVWEKGAEYDVTDPDLLAALLREGAAKESKDSGAADENKSTRKRRA